MRRALVGVPVTLLALCLCQQLAEQGQKTAGGSTALMSEGERNAALKELERAAAAVAVTVALARGRLLL